MNNIDHSAQQFAFEALEQRFEMDALPVLPTMNMAQSDCELPMPWPWSMFN